MVYMVGEAGPEGEKEKEIGEVKSEGNPWVVAGIMEKSKLVRAKGRKPMTLEAWMPRKIELKNKYNIFQVEEEKKEAEAIGAIKKEEESGVVRVTVDSGAAKNVWPRNKKGALRRKMETKPKLAVANGTKIEVYGAAVWEFEEGGRQCGMRFLDSDVRKPLAAVSAMNDEGNTVVFSRKWGNYIENDGTGKRIPLERVGETFEMVLKTKKLEEGTRKDVRWAEDGGKKFAGMEVDANDEESEKE
jgi:hypothetical protein